MVTVPRDDDDQQDGVGSLRRVVSGGEMHEEGAWRGGRAPLPRPSRGSGRLLTAGVGEDPCAEELCNAPGRGRWAERGSLNAAGGRDLRYEPGRSPDGRGDGISR